MVATRKIGPWVEVVLVSDQKPSLIQSSMILFREFLRAFVNLYVEMTQKYNS